MNKLTLPKKYDALVLITEYMDALVLMCRNQAWIEVGKAYCGWLAENPDKIKPEEYYYAKLILKNQYVSLRLVRRMEDHDV